MEQKNLKFQYWKYNRIKFWADFLEDPNREKKFVF